MRASISGVGIYQKHTSLIAGKYGKRGETYVGLFEAPITGSSVPVISFLGYDADGPSCRLTSVDWRLYAGWRPKESERAARALNAAVEAAVREGADLEEMEESLATVRERHAEAGAMDDAVAAVIRHVAVCLDGLRPAPAMR